MYLLENLTWPQAKEAFAKCKTAIVPWGSCEQHGPGCPIGTDFFSADFLLEELVKRDYPAIITPRMPIGFADYHSDYPGTLSFSYDTVMDAVREICKKLVSYGITHILFFNTHGGNAAPMGRVVYELRKKGFTAGVFMYYELAGKLNKKWAAIGHGDPAEASIVMAYKPELFDAKASKRPVHKLFGDTPMPDKNLLLFKDLMTVHLVVREKDLSENGSILEPHLFRGADQGQWTEVASPQDALDMRKAVIDYVEEFLPEFEKIHFEPISENF